MVIPRGGASLIDAVVREAQVPTIETGVGNCHVYVDECADLDVAERILLNSKTRRPSVCNAAETLLVDAAIAEQRRAQAGGRPAGRRGDGARRLDGTDEDALRREYLSMDIAVRGGRRRRRRDRPRQRVRHRTHRGHRDHAIWPPPNGLPTASMRPR